MIKSILVALDESKSSEIAKQVSTQFAKTFKASITGIGILDEPWIAAPEAIPLGGAAFKVELDQELLHDAKQRVHKIEASFMEMCKKGKFKCSIVDASGFPAYEIEHYIIEHDLLIIGKDANFRFDHADESTVLVRQILKDNPRPVIVTSSTQPNKDSNIVLVAFDGTFASSRALHMALMMGIYDKKTVHIATVRSDREEAKDLVDVAAKLCKNHDIKTTVHPIVTSQKPAKALLELMEDIKPSIIVMGAYGQGGLTYFFTGSCAMDLLKSTDIPIFFSH